MSKKFTKYPKSIRCSNDDPYGFRGAEAEANRTQLVQFVRRVRDLESRYADFLDDANFKFDITPWASEEQLELLDQAHDALQDIYHDISVDLFPSGHVD